ncbi:hypothetical protein ABZ840_08155 [Streptomyces sp. NPDC047117]|uniref:hypothetical protein n=1 Tax=Streptomyces sp. NPDC047117 TaxID=3155379 RepID=UPI0033C52098
MRTTKLDTTEFSFDILGPGGIPGGRITHQYAPAPGGISFYAETVIEVTAPVLGRLMNRILRPLLFSKATADHWIRHNTQETGRTHDILPALYAAAHPEGR